MNRKEYQYSVGQSSSGNFEHQSEGQSEVTQCIGLSPASTMKHPLITATLLRSTLARKMTKYYQSSNEQFQIPYTKVLNEKEEHCIDSCDQHAHPQRKSKQHVECKCSSYHLNMKGEMSIRGNLKENLWNIWCNDGWLRQVKKWSSDVNLLL